MFYNYLCSKKKSPFWSPNVSEGEEESTKCKFGSRLCHFSLGKRSSSLYNGGVLNEGCGAGASPNSARSRTSGNYKYSMTWRQDEERKIGQRKLELHEQQSFSLVIQQKK